MNTTYTVKKMTLKPSSKEHVETRLRKLDKFFDDTADAHVMFRVDNGQVKAELTIRAGSLVYRAEDADTDLLDAFDNACDGIVRKIRRQKTKLQKRLRPAAFDDEPQEDTMAEGEYEIIKTKHFAIKPLSPQEAILQMEMVGHSFYVFRNEDNGNVNVVYKRNDGNYGIIEPD